MKELIKKILREEVQRRFTKSNPNFERIIIKHMESIISDSKRIIPPPEENYGMFIEEWCKGGRIVLESRYHLDDDNDEFFAGDLYVNDKEIEFLSNMLNIRKSYILNVITEWYDENYASKFGPEVNHPEFEIFETFETDANRKCYEMINTDNLSREYIIDYLDTQTLMRRDNLENLSNDELKSKYRSVYNLQNNGPGN
jgi:hypothetical protein